MPDAEFDLLEDADIRDAGCQAISPQECFCLYGVLFQMPNAALLVFH